MRFDIKKKGRPSNREKSKIKLLSSPATIASVTSTVFVSSNPFELCDRLKLLLQEKQTGNNFNKNDEEFIAIVDRLSDYKCLSTKHKQILIKCNLLDTKKKSV